MYINRNHKIEIILMGFLADVGRTIKMNSEKKAVHSFWMIIFLNLMSQNMAGTVILVGACSVIREFQI